MTIHDTDWLEGRESAVGEAVPTSNLTKRELCAALGYSPARLDRLIRLGLPCRKGANNAAGYRFDLPSAVEWLCQHRAEERAGPEDESVAGAKRRLALAKAKAAEIENAVTIGQLVEADFMNKWIAAAYGGVRDRLYSLSSEIPGLTADQRQIVEDCVDAALTDVSDKAWCGHFRLHRLNEQTAREIEAEERATEDFDFD